MGSSCSKSDTPKKLGPIIICQSISKFLDINKKKHKNVIEKGPLFCVYSHDKKQEDSLPNSSLKIRDEDGNEAELYFETDAIFLNSSNGENERIFYDEIKRYKIIQIPGYNDDFIELVISSIIGNRAYFFIPQRYKNIINKILTELT